MRGLVVLLLASACGRVGFTPGDGAATADSTPADAYVHVPANRAFVTQFSYLATFGGPAMATTICQQHADMASLGGTWTPILGAGTGSAIDALASARGWEDMHGNYIADQASDWLDMSMRRPLRFDQAGNAVTMQVWLGTGGNTCGEWSTQSGMGGIGIATNAFTSFTVDACTTVASFACVETALQIAVNEPVVSGRRIFVTATGWTPANGLTGADAYCQQQASGAGLTGTYEAALATSSLGRFDRVASPASGFVNIRGLQLLAPGVDLRSFEYLDTFVTRPDGTPARPEGSFWAWSGSGGVTCGDWTGGGGAGSSGDASSVRRPDFDMRFDYACSGAQPLVCVED